MRLSGVSNTNLATLAAIFQRLLALSILLQDALLELTSFFLEHETIYTLIKLRIDLARAFIADILR